MSAKSYWTSTPEEIKTFFNGIESRQKEELASNYNLACMISQFVGASLNGEELPPIEKVYPKLFEDKQNQITEESMMFYKEQFMDYAKKHNENRAKKGLNNNDT